MKKCGPQGGAALSEITEYILITLLHAQDLDADVGLAVPLGDVGGVGIGEGHGIAHLDALAAGEAGVGNIDHVGLPLFGGGIIVAVALEDADPAGPSVDELDLGGQGGLIIIELGQRGSGAHLQDIAAGQDSHHHHSSQHQCDEFAHLDHLRTLLPPILPPRRRKSKKNVAVTRLPLHS